jgi:hypothetical protein
MPLALVTPTELRALAAEVQVALSVGEQAPPAGMREVRIGGEVLQFPYRTYYPSHGLRQAVESLSGQARAWGLGMCTRHWDGRIREWAATELEPTSYPWARAFAVQLLGEYVVEIAKVIEAKVGRTGTTPYLSFGRDNLAFLATTKRRATSYWACYYRSQYRQLNEFPNYRVISALQAEALGAA